MPGVCSIFICNDSGNSGGGATGQPKHSKEHIWVTATMLTADSGKVREIITRPNIYINLEKHIDGSIFASIEGHSNKLVSLSSMYLHITRPILKHHFEVVPKSTYSLIHNLGGYARNLAVVYMEANSYH